MFPIPMRDSLLRGSCSWGVGSAAPHAQPECPKIGEFGRRQLHARSPGGALPQVLAVRVGSGFWILSLAPTRAVGIAAVVRL